MNEWKQKQKHKHKINQKIKATLSRSHDNTLLYRSDSKDSG